MPPTAAVPEVTLRSIVQGVFWSVVFSAAATYIALKLGQGIESAIPISILAVGFSVARGALPEAARASTLLENVNVLAIGATSGIVAGGSVFTMPAIYILGLEGRSSFLQIFLVPLLGAMLGVFLLAPFRRYFVRDLHGKLPYPEGRATTEILMAGRRGGHSAVVLTYSALIAAVFDFVGPSMKRLGGDLLDARRSARSRGFTDAHQGRVHDEHLGGGLRPRLHHGDRVRGDHHGGLDGLLLRAGAAVRLPRRSTSPAAIPPGDAAARGDGARTTSSSLYVRPIGIGGIFAAGLLSILKMSPVIVQATRQALGEVVRLVRGRLERGDAGPHGPRRCRCRVVLLGIAGTGAR